jgi:hypothetical protein
MSINLNFNIQRFLCLFNQSNIRKKNDINDKDLLNDIKSINSDVYDRYQVLQISLNHIIHHFKSHRGFVRNGKLLYECNLPINDRRKYHLESIPVTVDDTLYTFSFDIHRGSLSGDLSPQGLDDIRRRRDSKDTETPQ